MRKYLFSILFCLSVSAGIGQVANYKLADRFTDSRLKELVKSMKVEPNFLKNSDKFWYMYETGEGIRYYFVDPSKRLHRELFDRDYVAGEISKVTGEAKNAKEMKLSLFFDEDGTSFTFYEGSMRFRYDMKTETLEKVEKKDDKKKTPAGKKTMVGTYSPDSAYVVYARKHNLYLFSVADSVERQLTMDGTKDSSYTENSSQEKNVPAKVRWFADSKSFVVERTVKLRDPQKFGLISFAGIRPTVMEYDYAIPGDERVEKTEFFFFRTDGPEGVKVAADKWTDQLVTLYPSGDAKGGSKHIYFTRKRRTCDEMEVCRIEPDSGTVKVVFNEVSKPYFNEPFFHLSFLKGGDELLWWSERTGSGHLYRYDCEGNLLNAISSGPWVTGRVVKVDEKNGYVYFEGYGQNPEENPYLAQIYKASLDGKKRVRRLTPEEAMHKVKFAESGRYFIDNYSRPDLEPRSVVRDSEGRLVCELCSPDLSRLYATGWKAPEPFTVKAADGVTDLYGYMWKPIDFDSTKTYPIISYVYPGPQMDAVPQEFNMRGYYNMGLAQVGFVVVTFGHRGGTPVRDRWYHTYGHGNLRDYPLADDKCGIEQLADRYPFIDRDRVGICGHSGGGFMSTAAICTYPDFYKAAVSSSGNHDNSIYNLWWGETHHGVKEVRAKEKRRVKNPVTGKDTTIVEEKTKFEFKVANNMELAKNLKGHLMLVHGSSDKNVHLAHSLRMADALIKASKKFELVILPGQGHYYTGESMYFFERKLWFHFAKHLLGDDRCDDYVQIDDYLRE